MSLAKLVCTYNKNLQRVFTDPKRTPKSEVDILSKRTKTNKDGSIVLTLLFADGNSVRVTYEDVV